MLRSRRPIIRLRSVHRSTPTRAFHASPNRPVEVLIESANAAAHHGADTFAICRDIFVIAAVPWSIRYLLDLSHAWKSQRWLHWGNSRTLNLAFEATLKRKRDEANKSPQQMKLLQKHVDKVEHYRTALLDNHGLSYHQAARQALIPAALHTVYSTGLLWLMKDGAFGSDGLLQEARAWALDLQAAQGGIAHWSMPEGFIDLAAPVSWFAAVSCLVYYFWKSLSWRPIFVVSPRHFYHWCSSDASRSLPWKTTVVAVNETLGTVRFDPQWTIINSMWTRFTADGRMSKNLAQQANQRDPDLFTSNSALNGTPHRDKKRQLNEIISYRNSAGNGCIYLWAAIALSLGSLMNEAQVVYLFASLACARFHALEVQKLRLRCQANADVEQALCAPRQPADKAVKQKGLWRRRAERVKQLKRNSKEDHSFVEL